MANTLTGLTPTIYAAMDVVAREQVGMVQSVRKDPTLERAAVGDPVKYPIVGQGAATDVTPANVPPNDGDHTVTNDSITITKSRRYPIKWNGEQTMSMGTYGLYDKILADEFAQGIRTLSNEIENDLVEDAVVNASLAYGTSGTTPFATANLLTDFAGPKDLSRVAGSPLGDLRMVLNGAAMINLEGKQSGLFKVNEAGTDDLLRQGTLGRIQGFNLANSPEFSLHTKGTAASSTTDNAGYAVGATSIVVAAAGTGTILAGDIITFAGDTRRYVVKTGVADVSVGGTMVLNGAGLETAMSAATKAITHLANYTPNLWFPSSSIVLSTRAPALPIVNGVAKDMAIDRMMITDPFSGIAFEVAVYLEYRQILYEISLAWGFKVTNSKYVGILQG